MKNNKYFLCIDNGLSLGKTALVDSKGNIAGIESFKTEIVNDGGYSEIDMDLLASKTFNAIKKLIAKNDIDPRDIIAVGNSGHGGGLYLVDNKGNPVRNGITSMDSRGEDLINKWKRDGLSCYEETYTNMWNGQAIPLLHWIKEHEKENFDSTYKILFCKDWIKLKLTGQYSTDYTDSSNAGLVNLKISDYDPGIYKIYDISDIYEKLPEFRRSNEVAGYITKEAANKTGLKERTPVIGGLVDFIACLIGCGLNDTNTYSVVSGTWGINTAIKSDLNISPGIMSTVLFPDGSRFLAMDTSPNSAVNLEWFLSEVLEKIANIDLTREEIYKKIEENIPKLNINESSILYFPFIYRSKLTEKMQGVFYNFNASHDLYDLIFSIYEGVVFSHLLHINNLKKGGIDCNKLVLSGGASNSKFWCQMFSDILNMEVKTTYNKEVGILGLAIYQAIGLGLYKKLKDAIDDMVKIQSTYKPDSNNNSIYMRRFSEFKKLKKILDK